MSNLQRVEGSDLPRRVGRQVLTVTIAVITLLFAALLTWASLAPPRDTGLPTDTGPVNDLPANLTWLLLIGIAIVAWRQIAVGLVTAIGCAVMVVIVAFTEVARYSAAGQGGAVHLLIYLIAFIQAGAFVAIGVATGIFGWHQRRMLRAARDETH